ncbi:hypothetical protein TREAZ_3640 [Leadbettera azotonutricia ZAS-9]|uniref:Uncharacterized protein n=1 Tax=Leadbettera azotonutricia (strain ATCC BAA-888 / DSM 13862 / ZAS-9) TaxID=545695 RepID=F5YGA0_LEAAZ|nr:hypothetical protein TREAZ_3640 [Leadbettera azotonutricia ZAS-9]
MIIDLIGNMRKYIPLVPGLKKVVEILESVTLKEIIPRAYTTSDPSVR